MLAVAKTGCASPPKLTLSEWADAVRQVSAGTSPEAGAWLTAKVPYARAVMDAISDPNIGQVVLQWAIQLGKTEIILNALGFFIDCDPCAILLVLPTIEIAEDFSRERIAPMIRDTRVLRERVPGPKSRDGSNTLRKKEFPGGFLSLAGANSAASLSFRPCRVVLGDEVDKWPLSAGTEGDPVNIAVGRTSNFWNSKVVLCSSPTVKDASRIEAALESSTREFYCVACPACAHGQVLDFERIDFSSVRHRCERCGGFFSKPAWLREPGKWVATRPLDEHGARVTTRGFCLSALYSPWVSWEKLIAEFREAEAASKAGDNYKLQVFINTRLAKTWELRGEKVEEDLFGTHREIYAAQVPDGVLVLTAGTDVQDNRLQTDIRGWGRAKESWGIEYLTIYGDTKAPAVWEEHDRLVLDRLFHFADGAAIQVRRVCVDARGHATEEVYGYAKKRQPRALAVEGIGGLGVPLIKKHGHGGKMRAPLIQLGVDTGKEEITSKLRVEQPGPGYCHFPRGATGEAVAGYDQKYFAGLTAERRIVKYDKGFKKFIWIKRPSQENEPFDCFNYSLAALYLCHVDLDTMSREAVTPGPESKNPRGRASSPSFGVLAASGVGVEGTVSQTTGKLEGARFGVQNKPINW
jgi:phage terminase large subunit GpA-like protein